MTRTYSDSAKKTAYFFIEIKMQYYLRFAQYSLAFRIF